MPRFRFSCCVLALASCALPPVELVPCVPVEGGDPPIRCSIAHRAEAPIEDASPDVTRFFVIGDAGVAFSEDPSQLAASTAFVANLTDRVCDARGGCDFGVFLGDNVYETGVATLDTRAFLHAFAERYTRGWSRPIVFVLGNHDYDPIRPTHSRAREELGLLSELAEKHPRMVLGRAHFFEVRAGPVALFAWDTNHLVRGCEPAIGGLPDCLDEQDGVLRALDRAQVPFKLWLGHHPYWSNGDHGDAGDFEDGGFSLWRGGAFQQLAREYVVGKADLMLSGHDHNLQAFVHPHLRGTALVVTGAGGKTTPLRPRSRRGPSVFEEDGVLGLTLVEATADELRVEIYGAPRGPCGTVPHLTPSALAPRFTMRRARGEAWRVEPSSEPDAR